MEATVYSSNLLDKLMRLTNSNQSNEVENENNLSYLAHREKLKEKQVIDTIQKYLRLTIKSSNRLKEYRNLILQNVNELMECYLSEVEIYNLQITRNNEILEILNQWELKKTKILDKVQDIRTNNEFGIKYNSLIAESEDNLNKISQLRLELIKLENKQSLLNNELLNTKNIVESKLFKFNESFKQIEDYQKFTLRNLNSKHLPNPSANLHLSTSPNSSSSINSSQMEYYSPTANISSKTALQLSPKYLLQDLTTTVYTGDTIESIILQKQAIDDMIDMKSQAYSDMESFLVVIEFTFEVLDRMETELSLVLQSTDSPASVVGITQEEKLSKILKDTVGLLHSKLLELKDTLTISLSNKTWLGVLNSILHTEIKTLEKSIALVDANYNDIELPDIGKLSLSLSISNSPSLSPSPSNSTRLSPPPALLKSRSQSPSQQSLSALPHSLSLKTPSPVATLPKLSQTSAFASILSTSPNSPSPPVITNSVAMSTNSTTDTVPKYDSVINKKPVSSFKKYIDVNNGLTKTKGSKKD